MKKITLKIQNGLKNIFYRLKKFMDKEIIIHIKY
jgi:hypothetical protein